MGPRTYLGRAYSLWVGVQGTRGTGRTADVQCIIPKAMHERTVRYCIGPVAYGTFWAAPRPSPGKDLHDLQQASVFAQKTLQKI